MSKDESRKRIVCEMEEARIRFQKKTTEYGSAYLSGGDVLKSLFPSGIMLDTAEEFNRFIHLVYIVGKVHRYSMNFHNGGHKDSMDDLAIYAYILNDLDQMEKDKKRKHAEEIKGDELL